MNPMKALTEAYQALSQSLEGLITPYDRAPFPAHLSLTRRILSRPELNAYLESLAGQEDLSGWQLLPSELRVLPGDALATDMPVIELVARTSGQHVQIRHRQGDTWALQEATLVRTEVENANVLAEACTHLAARPELGRLRFLRLWEPDEDGALRVQQSIFDGFEGDAA